MRNASPPEPRASGLRVSARRNPATFAAVIAIMLSAACSKPSAWGEATSLILVASDEIWPEIEADTYSAAVQRIR